MQKAMPWRHPASYLCLAILLLVGSAPAVLADTPSTEGWIVHRSASIDNMERGPNLLVNPGFESGGSGWVASGAHFQVDDAVAHSGSQSIRLDKSGDLSSAAQEVVLNQSAPEYIYVGGWSKAQEVSTNCDMQYSLYLDIVYRDGTMGYSPYVCYTRGTHDWEYVDLVFRPEKPIASVHVWTMFYSRQQGAKAWFDDIQVCEYVDDVIQFDAGKVALVQPTTKPWDGGDTLRVSSSDGLSLGLSDHGGAVTSLMVEGEEQVEAENVYAGGFYVQDAAADSDYVHLGGSVVSSGEDLIYTGSDVDLGLELSATFQSHDDHILIDASLQDTTGSDRAVSLYFALPLAPSGRTWWRDIRSSSPATAATEHSYALETDWGRGFMSEYCLSSLSGSAGLAMAYPMDRPVVSRLAYNSSTEQYFFVADLGLSPATQPPGQADVRFLLYHHDPAWGFRAAFDKYVDIYPQFFTDRVEEDGIWVAHADLDSITDIEDFYVKFHESGNSRIYAYDDSVDSYTLRYLGEPWGYRLYLPQGISPSDYGAVMDHVHNLLSDPVANTRRWANAILGSGEYDAQGRFRYEVGGSSYNPVAAFSLNADPDIDIPEYQPNRAEQGWKESTKEPYYHPEWGILDGEYIDSFEHGALLSNYRQEHFPFTQHPLTFDSTENRPVLPHLFSCYDFVDWVAGDVHDLGKYVMGNSVLVRWAFPGHLFDIMGCERNWVLNGQFFPDGDALLNLWRTFSYHKPYCVLQTSGVPAFDHQMVEDYFNLCTFYGIYPSFFSHDGGATNYWERPDWYNRDRDLFMEYIPKIMALNEAGWEPVTGARSNQGHVYVERYGKGTEFYLTLRNVSEQGVEATIALDARALGLSSLEDCVAWEWLSDAAVPATLTEGGASLTLQIPAESTRIVRLELTEGPRAETYPVDLHGGWNLVSVPGLPTSNAPQELFASIEGQFGRMHTYDAAEQSWRTYDPSAPGDATLTGIHSGQGIWVHATSDTTWQAPCEMRNQVIIPLHRGWNLVGYPLRDAQDIASAIASVEGALDIIYRYDGSKSVGPWEMYAPRMPGPLNTFDTFEPAGGYWIKASEPCSWTLQSPVP